jgi:hypothetical protein
MCFCMSFSTWLRLSVGSLTHYGSPMHLFNAHVMYVLCTLLLIHYCVCSTLTRSAHLRCGVEAARRTRARSERETQ